MSQFINNNNNNNYNDSDIDDESLAFEMLYNIYDNYNDSENDEQSQPYKVNNNNDSEGQSLPDEVLYNIASFTDYDTTKNISLSNKKLNQLVPKTFVDKKYMDKYKRYLDEYKNSNGEESLMYFNPYYFNKNKGLLSLYDYKSLYNKFYSDLDFVKILINDPNYEYLLKTDTKPMYGQDNVLTYSDIFYDLLNEYDKNSDINKLINILNVLIKKPNFDINQTCVLKIDGVMRSYENDKILYNFLLNNGYKINLRKCAPKLKMVESIDLRYYVDAGVDPNYFINHIANIITKYDRWFDSDDVEYMVSKGLNATTLLYKIIHNLNTHILDLRIIDLLLDYGATIGSSDVKILKNYISKNIKKFMTIINTSQMNTLMEKIDEATVAYSNITKDDTSEDENEYDSD